MLKIPKNDYPRPQFVRNNWTNLNGKWDFEYDYGKSGLFRGITTPEYKYNHEILVPFCPESELSMIGNKDFMNCIWYRRTFNISEDQMKNRVILHFGAVDYHATVYINGMEVCEHFGGYSSFSADITKCLHAGENYIYVCAEDEIRSGDQPRGKQTSIYCSCGCDYTRTTGIWQTVWLEEVPDTYLKAVKILTDYTNDKIQFTANIAGTTDNLSGFEILTEISFEGKRVSEKRVDISNISTNYEVTVENPVLWDVGKPNLYDITYKLIKDGEELDIVTSYTGFRTITLNDKGVLINGKVVFQRLVLDQGFYPDGIYTAPTDEALKRDIELSMALGFNGARLHEKIFEERFLYWADKMGYIVWGEHANWGMDITRASSLTHFIAEWFEAVERDYNHPSIVGWCPFNETPKNQYSRVVEIVYETTKVLDPSRPVIDVSGFHHVKGTDIYDIHCYEQEPAQMQRYLNLNDGEHIFDPNGDGQHYKGELFAVSEFGGIKFTDGSDKEAWGYGSVETEDQFAEKFAGLTRVLMDNKFVCMACYTQLYDVEQEQNGLYKYDRSPKFSKQTYEKIRQANIGIANIEK